MQCKNCRPIRFQYTRRETEYSISRPTLGPTEKSREEIASIDLFVLCCMTNYFTLLWSGYVSPSHHKEVG